MRFPALPSAAWGLTAFVVSSVLLTPASRATEVRDLDNRVHAIGIDLGNVESVIKRLEREVVNPVAQSRYYPLEKRLIDARVYFEMKNHAKAAVLYMDATEYADFAQHSDRADVLFRLGFSLYKLKNYLAAKDYFEQLIGITGGELRDKALRYLIEIGLSVRGGDGLEAAVERVGALAGRSAEAQYTYGKGLYRLGRTNEALAALGQISASSPLYLPSQYYMGVIHTDLGRLDEAIAAFRRVASAPESAGAHARIRELAHLGIGRLYLENRDYTRAVDAYQEIDRHSEHFHTALYEMTWAYVNSKQFDKALNALEILLLTVEDEQLATEANILRGRLNIMLDRTDVAVEAYNDIVEQFSPLQNELNRFSKKRDSLAQYFRWLLQRHADAFELGAVLSERASKWVEGDEQLKEVIGLFDDMSFQRRDVAESEQIIEELQMALASGNRVEIFPNLKNAWTRIIVSENQLVALSQAAVDTLGRIAAPHLTPSEAAAYQALVERRKRLERSFADTPKTTAEFSQRTAAVQRRYADLKRESFLLESSLRQVRDELAALEKWLNDARFGGKGRKLSSGEEQEVVTLLAKEKQRLRALYDELLALKGQIDAQRAGVGAGDVVSQSEESLRERLLDLHGQEQNALVPALRRMGGSTEARFASSLEDLRRRILGNVGRLSQLMGRIDEAVAAKVAEYQREIAAEKKLVAIYRRQVDAFNRDSDRIATEIGVPLFRMAHKRLTDVVLEADLGLVDVAWKRKEAESDRILALQEEQAEQLKHLEQTMKGILEE